MTNSVQASIVGDDSSQIDHSFSQAVLDALAASVAVVNQEGTIIAVNAAWRSFAAENGGCPEDRIGVGVNYLKVAYQATGPFADEAQ